MSKVRAPVFGLLTLTALAVGAGAHASVGVTSEAWLIDQAYRARETGRTDIHRDVVEKLIRINPSNPAYWIEALRLHITDPASTPEQTAAYLERLCATHPGQVCRRAQEQAEIVRRNSMRLSEIELLATAGRHAEALEKFSQIFPSVPSDDYWRVRYYDIMLWVAGRQREAIAGLERLAATSVLNRDLARNALNSFAIGTRYKTGWRDYSTLATEALLRTHPDHERAGFWRAELVDAYNDRGDDAYKLRQWSSARRHYNAALSLDSANADAIESLARIELESNNPHQARRWLTRLSGLAGVDRRTVGKLEARILTLEIAHLRDELSRRALTESARRSTLARLAELEARRIRVEPDDPWNLYHLTDTYLKLGRTQEAAAIWKNVPQARLRSRQWGYPYALALAAMNRDEEAVAHADACGINDARLKSLRERLARSSMLARADALAARGRYAEALEELRRLGPNADPWLLWKQVRWARAAGKDDVALGVLDRLMHIESETGQAHADAGEILLARSQAIPAYEHLIAAARVAGAVSIWTLRQSAEKLRQLGFSKEADALYTAMAKSAEQFTPEQRALYETDLAQNSSSPDARLLHSRKALAHLGMIASPEVDKKTFTAALRTPDEPVRDWIRNRAVDQAVRTYDENNPKWTSAVEFVRDTGSAGYSDTRMTVAMLEHERTLAGGTLRLRTDRVKMDEGRLSTRPWGSKFGHVYTIGSDGSRRYSKDSGQSFALAWNNEIWSMDIGTTPIGFLYSDVVGSLARKFDLNTDWSMTLEASRRPKESSLLAFGGARDPLTGRKWGAIRSNALAVSAHRSLSESSGIWLRASAEALRGHNVADNSALRLMGGYYTSLIDRPNEQLRAGTSTMFWHFDKNQSGYTFGQGGYYSPQFYLSQGISLEWRRRTPLWSWDIEGRLGLGYVRKDGYERYPDSAFLTAAQRMLMKDYGVRDSGSSGASVSYGLRWSLERRLNSHLVIGSRGEIDHSQGYNPISLQLYLRLYTEPWQGDLPMPPKPLTRYSGW